MIRYVYRHFLLEPVRTGLIVLSVSSVVAVILLLEGFYSGLLTQLRQTVLNRQADLIILQAGVSNMTAARSILPQFTRLEVEAIEGVRAAHPLTGISAIYEHEGARSSVFLLVFDNFGGPGELAKGTELSTPRSVVVDRSLSDKYNLEIDDPLVLSGFRFRIAGVTEGSAAFFTPFVFARYDDLIDFYLESDTAADITTFPLVSFLLVELEANVDPATIAATIERDVPEADVMTPELLAEADSSLGRVLFGPIMRLLIGVSYAIGALVTGIIMFAAVNSRRRELGVLKALGFSNKFLQGSVLCEALVLAIVSLPLGAVLAGSAAAVIEAAAPLYLISVFEWQPVLRTSMACMVFAVIGALLPLTLIRKVDPAAVFGT